MSASLAPVRALHVAGEGQVRRVAAVQPMARLFAAFVPRRRTTKEGHMKKIDIAQITELKTSVGIHGAAKQKEVAGPLCLALFLAAGTYITGGAEKKPF
jgi:hypothetical protein